ncbi:hypothetical protein ACI2KX_10830 [Ectopseudomonas khazarica]|uniref:hypothetical protein n=1 Tax=Ectopseudomonas khazarica TaxID=2502979 RepID=UPI00384BE071
MKLFKDEDGCLEVLAKSATILGVLFGVWAYFNTIHPVFEKEMELQGLRGESQVLASNLNELKASVAALRQDKSALLNSVGLLKGRQKDLLEEIDEKERDLRNMTASFENASDAAVLNKLQFYSNKLTSAHHLAVVAGKGETFDVFAVSKEILADNIPDKADEHARKAYSYFERYVQDRSGEEIKGSRVTEFAVSLFFDYKIGILERRMTSSQ